MLLYAIVVVIICLAIPELRNLVFVRLIVAASRVWLWCRKGGRPSARVVVADDSPSVTPSSTPRQVEIRKIKPSASFTPTSKHTIPDYLRPRASSVSSEHSATADSAMQSLSATLQIKWGFPWLFRSRYVELHGCSLSIYRPNSHNLLYTFPFQGGKVLNSRSQNTLKLVNPNSQTLYICCYSAESFAAWAKAITHNLKMHTAQVWEREALNMHALASITRAEH